MYDRRVYLGEWSETGPEKGRTTLTPNANAARTLGVEPLSLETLARQILGDERIAAPLIIQHLLRQAVEEALGSSDPDGERAHCFLGLGSCSAPTQTLAPIRAHRGRGV
jgi:hypothetical protein